MSIHSHIKNIPIAMIYYMLINGKKSKSCSHVFVIDDHRTEFFGQVNFLVCEIYRSGYSQNKRSDMSKLVRCPSAGYPIPTSPHPTMPPWTTPFPCPSVTFSSSTAPPLVRLHFCLPPTSLHIYTRSASFPTSSVCPYAINLYLKNPPSFP